MKTVLPLALCSYCGIWASGVLQALSVCAELGLVLPAVLCTQLCRRDGGSTDTRWKGGLGLFYSAEFSSDPAGRQLRAPLEACFINEETEAGSGEHSQNSVGTSCSKTGSEISPLGKGSLILEENSRWWEVYRPHFPAGNLNFIQKNWRNLIKILRKLRLAPSKARSKHSLLQNPTRFSGFGRLREGIIMFIRVEAGR